MTDTETVYRETHYADFDYPKSEVDLIISKYIDANGNINLYPCINEIVLDMKAWAGDDVKVGNLTIGIQSQLNTIWFKNQMRNKG